MSFLFKQGVTTSDLSVCVPNPHSPQPLPPVYTGDEAAKLLLSVDRTSGLAKRD
jgi:site-specific recombinase XerD